MVSTNVVPTSETQKTNVGNEDLSSLNVGTEARGAVYVVASGMCNLTALGETEKAKFFKIVSDGVESVVIQSQRAFNRVMSKVMQNSGVATAIAGAVLSVTLPTITGGSKAHGSLTGPGFDKPLIDPSASPACLIETGDTLQSHIDLAAPYQDTVCSLESTDDNGNTAQATCVRLWSGLDSQGNPVTYYLAPGHGVEDKATHVMNTNITVGTSSNFFSPTLQFAATAVLDPSYDGTHEGSSNDDAILTVHAITPGTNITLGSGLTVGMMGVSTGYGQSCTVGGNLTFTGDRMAFNAEIALIGGAASFGNDYGLNSMETPPVQYSESGMLEPGESGSAFISDGQLDGLGVAGITPLGSNEYGGSVYLSIASATPFILQNAPLQSTVPEPGSGVAVVAAASGLAQLSRRPKKQSRI